MIAMSILKCSECDAEISIPSDTIDGELVTCGDCGESFETMLESGVIKITPAQSVGEDWGE